MCYKLNDYTAWKSFWKHFQSLHISYTVETTINIPAIAAGVPAGVLVVAIVIITTIVIIYCVHSRKKKNRISNPPNSAMDMQTVSSKHNVH